jgi:adenosylcobinamide kinase/adenosylcobinamide-phosphate guanylyltransferase
MGELVFILGPARSGKSRLAERLASERGPNVLYLATLEPLDGETRQRVASHRTFRPAHWATVEEPLDVEDRLRGAGQRDACILDSLTVWVSNLLLALPSGDEYGPSARESVLGRVRSLVEWQAQAPSPLIVVSDEVGGGLVPPYPLGRAFRDLQGEANHILAAAADHLYYTVAGHYLDLKVLGARKIEGDSIPSTAHPVGEPPLAAGGEKNEG